MTKTFLEGGPVAEQTGSVPLGLRFRPLLWPGVPGGWTVTYIHSFLSESLLVKVFIPTAEGKLEQGSALSPAFHLRCVLQPPTTASIATAKSCGIPPQAWEIRKIGSTELEKVGKPTGQSTAARPRRSFHQPEGKAILSLHLVDEEAVVLRCQQPVQMCSGDRSPS